MAKLPSEISNRQVIQLLRTSGTSEHVSAVLPASAASGEIAIQLSDEASATSLWTLAKDGKKAVQFVNKEQVTDMIKNGAVAEVDKIKKAVDLADDGTYRPKAGTSYLDKATTVEGEIEALDKALNGVQNQIYGMDATTVADDNKIVSDVIQTDGKITASVKNVTEVKLGGYVEGGDDSGKVAEGDTLGQALGKLQGQINGMDKDASAADGQVVTTISQVDGKVSETKANVKDLQLGGYAKDAEAKGDIAATDTINAALSKLENKANAITISNDDKSINVTSSATGTVINVNIKEGEKVIRKDGNGGLFTDIKITGATQEELGGLGANVKEAYKLLDSDGGQLGDWIKIYKDSALKEVYLGHVDDALASDSSPVVTSGTGETALCFIYYTVEGKYQLVAVNVEEFLQESEFKDGLSVDNHQVKVKIDVDSEKDSQSAPVSFLTVGPDGLKLSGVKEEITRKIEALVYTDTAFTGQYVTKVDEANGKISVERANVSEAVLNNYVKGTDATAVVAADSVNTAISKLENQIDKAKAAATTKVEKDAQANHLTLTPSTAADGSVTYRIGESNIASKTDLDAEIAARKAVDGQDGQTYTANKDANYISAVTSLNAADVQLDAILGKDESTVFDKTNTVAKNISDIKNDLAAFKSKLTLSGKDNAYAKVTVVSDATGTTIEVSAKTQSIATSTKAEEGLADAYDVKTFAIKDVKQTSEETSSGVKVEAQSDGSKLLDFSGLKIDCGEF